MLKRMTTGMVVVIAAMTSASAQTVDQKRKLYALLDAGPAYCPAIEVKWFAKGSIGYDMSPDGEYEKFADERKLWFNIFKKAGSRAGVCDALMEKYGPGADIEFFQFK